MKKKVHVIYDKEDGEIIHTHEVYDGSSDTFRIRKKEEVISDLQDFFPEPDKVDVLIVDSSELDSEKMIVHPKERRLVQRPPPEKKEKKEKK